MDKFFIVFIIVFLLIIFSIISHINNRRRWAYIKSKIEDAYGKACDRKYGDGEYFHIPGYCNNHETDYRIDDITWNDLNLDSIFMEMNYCQSSAGEEYLYYMLRNPDITNDSREDLERKIRYYQNNPDKRLNMQIALYKCGRTGKYSIYDYLNNLDIIEDENFNSDIWLLLMYVVAIIVLFVNFTIGIASLVCLLVYGGITYFSKKRRIEPYITSFSYVFRVLDGVKTVCAVDNDAIQEEQDELKKLRLSMSKFERFSYLIMYQNDGTGNLIDIILDYIKIFFHIDIIKFFQMRNQLKLHFEDIDKMLTIMGQIDSSIAIASYREYLGKYCIPEWSDKDFDAGELYHPLLKDPVSNDIRLDKGILLTGSNASGKSTMLKTVTVAAILAQSIHTVPAKSYSSKQYRIYTSLALNDDIFAGESYYMTEIKSLKRIIDEGNNGQVPILACVDEVLRGTNTIERISASSVILRKLSEVNGRILAATHDLELASLLDDCYDNYHFEETIDGNDISFAYKMISGMATTRNAIKLLEIVGYDEAITKEASLIAANYEKTGMFVREC